MLQSARLTLSRQNPYGSRARDRSVKNSEKKRMKGRERRRIEKERENRMRWSRNEGGRQLEMRGGSSDRVWV